MSLTVPHKIGLLVLSALLLASRSGAEDVTAPAKRIEVLTAGKGLLSAKEGAVSAKDPFHSEAFAETLAANSGVTLTKTSTDVAPVRAGPRTNRDLLQAIATSLKPRYLEMSGQPILFFGQKRVKAGDSVTINFEGSDYALEVVSIDRPNFTLRLNRDEFTRPIK